MLYDPLFRRPVHASRFEHTAASTKVADREWWDKLSRQQQQDYLKQHPNTVYKKLGVKHPGNSSGGPSTTIEQEQNKKFGNTPGDEKVKALNQNVDAKLQRLQQLPHIQKALEPGSPQRKAAADSIRSNTNTITEHFKKEVPPEGVSKTADQLRTLMNLPPETPEQQLRNSLFTGGAAILARTAFMHYGVPALGLTPGLGLAVGTGIASVVLFGTMREMLKRRSQKQNVQKIAKEAQPHHALSSLLVILADELDDAPHLDQMDDDAVIHTFLGRIADTMEHSDMPLSYWARGFDLNDQQPQGDPDVRR